MSGLVLGTAQWGNPYGITNARGRLSDEDVAAIAAVARARGVTDIDTARGYGDSEKRLRPFASEFSITTKVSGSSDVAPQIQDSLEALGVEQLGAVLVHDWDSLDQRSRVAVARGLREALAAGVVERVGVSVYDEVGIESANAVFLDEGVPLTVLQVPANPLDRRLDDSTLLMELAGAGAEIVVRSAFLQGVLLADEGRWSDHPDVERFRTFVADQGMSALSACMGHERALPWATHVVVGVTSAQELSEVCDAWDRCQVALLPSALASSDTELIDPRRW